MTQISKYVLMFAAAAGLLFSTGCKSDCEKAYDNMKGIMEKSMEEGLKQVKDEATKKKMKEAFEKEFKKDEIMKKCEKEPKEVQSCLAGAKTEKDMDACDKKGKKDKK